MRGAPRACPPCGATVAVLLGVVVAVCACDRPPSRKAARAPVPPTTDRVSEAERPTVEELPALDTHVDTPQRMLDEGADITRRLADGHLDLPRMRQGGLHGAFFSVWVDPRRYRGEAAWDRALELARVIRELPQTHPDDAALCTTARQVREAIAGGKIAVLIGVEGAHALGTDRPQQAFERLKALYELGARYMTLTWSTDNAFGHSSTGAHPERGLTRLGRRLVAEMNRLGMVVDVSHVSDATFSDIMDTTTEPVWASHSSARALADHPRNVTDAMIRRIAEGGGAVCVNFYPRFIDARYAAEKDAVEPPGVEVLGAHFEHVVQTGGPGAACLGSDFDGVSELPRGLSDVASLPVLRAELVRRDLPVKAIFADNVLRVLDAQQH